MQIAVGCFALLIGALWVWSIIDSAIERQANEQIWEAQARDL